MKKLPWILVLAMVFSLVTATATFADQSAPAPVKAPEQIQQMNQADPPQVELTGTLTHANQFIDDTGENYQLIPSEKSAELQEHLGEKIKVKATVMEDNEGFKSIDVSDYKIVE
jgi:hypothetical protein